MVGEAASQGASQSSRLQAHGSTGALCQCMSDAGRRRPTAGSIKKHEQKACFSTSLARPEPIRPGPLGTWGYRQDHAQRSDNILHSRRELQPCRNEAFCRPVAGGARQGVQVPPGSRTSGSGEGLRHRWWHKHRAPRRGSRPHRAGHRRPALRISQTHCCRAWARHAQRSLRVSRTWGRASGVPCDPGVPGSGRLSTSTLPWPCTTPSSGGLGSAESCATVVQEPSAPFQAASTLAGPAGGCIPVDATTLLPFHPGQLAALGIAGSGVADVAGLLVL